MSHLLNVVMTWNDFQNVIKDRDCLPFPPHQTTNYPLSACFGEKLPFGNETSSNELKSLSFQSPLSRGSVKVSKPEKWSIVFEIIFQGSIKKMVVSPLKMTSKKNSFFVLFLRGKPRLGPVFAIKPTSKCFNYAQIGPKKRRFNPLKPLSGSENAFRGCSLTLRGCVGADSSCDPTRHWWERGEGVRYGLDGWRDRQNRGCGRRL